MRAHVELVTALPAATAQRRTTRTRVVAAGIAEGVAMAWLSFQLALFGTVLLGSAAFEGPAVVLTSGSMEPLLSVGDVVLTIPAEAEQVEGHIVTFWRSGSYVTHRVVEIDTNEGTVRTKGDANAANDSAVVPLDAIEGRVRLAIPYAGLPRTWWDDRHWVALGGWLVVTLIAFDLVATSLRATPQRVSGSRP